MSTDPFAQFKERQREAWGHFVPLEAMTCAASFPLVQFAGVKAGESVLDVACGTGVATVTAARRGASVTGIDLSPVLLDRAKFNGGLAGVEIAFREGDVEALPFAEGAFDVVMSQFGHIFAPRPASAVSEMLRVLKPGGRIAFATWPPELFMGRLFSLIQSYVPPAPDIPLPVLWGEPNVIRERLKDSVIDLAFERERLLTPTLSPQHFRALVESASPQLLALKDKPERLSAFRKEFERLIAEFMQGNAVKQDFLLTRAVKPVR